MTEGEVSVRAQARDRALQFLDFLDAYYSLRFPPVSDIADYDDEQLRGHDLVDLPGVNVQLGGERWLTMDLVERPAPPIVPEELQERLSGEVTSHGVPTLAPVAEELPAPDDESADEFGDEPPTEDELEAILEDWIAEEWRPWSDRYAEVERGRSLYKRLFDLATRLEREQDVIECVWGFGRLQWRPQVEGRSRRVDYPLLTVPLELSVEQPGGRVVAAPSGGVVVENGWVVGLPLSDPHGFNDQRTSSAELELDPWSPETRTTLRSLLRAVDHDGVLIEEDDDRSRAAVGQATLDLRDWLIFVRRRETNLRHFLESQRQLYGELGVQVPDPFAALVIDEPSALDPLAVGRPTGTDSTALDGMSDDERLLLPLPSNDEQMRILQLARHRAGVTAQGPPGTGKSHTIANLIAHYMAHGQRVLVTAEKEQALRVLIDKVPEAIRDLCVPVIGSDVLSRMKLQRTVTTIADAVHRRPDAAAIARIERDLEQLERQFAATTNALRTRRAKETERPPAQLTSGQVEGWSPSTAAQWVNEQRPRLAGIPDRVPPDRAVPLSDAELAELTALCRSIDASDADEALSDLPDPAMLPTGGRLASLRLEAERLRDTLSNVADVVSDWSRLDVAGAQRVQEVEAELLQWSDWHVKVAGTWLRHVLAEVGDPALAASWEDFLTGATAEREAVLAAARALAATTVTIAIAIDDGSETGPPFVMALNEARTLLANARKIGWSRGATKKVIGACRVDGRAVTTVADVDLVMAEVTRRVQRRRLATRWSNMAARTGALALPEHGTIEIAIGEWLPMVRAALDWSRTVWPALRQHLGELGVNAPTSADGSDVTRFAATCRTLMARARLVDIERELDAHRERLQIAAVAPSASSLWRRLNDAFDVASDAVWDQLRDEAGRLQILREAAARRVELLGRLVPAAPKLAAAVEAGERTVDPALFVAAWCWRQTDVWLDQLDQGPEPRELQAQLEQLSKDIRRVTTELVAAKAWAAVADGMDDRRRQALNRFTMANAKIGKGTGRYVPRWEAELRAAMDDAKDAVPVWIMPIHKVLSSFLPNAEPPFDVIVVDEASQVSLLQTPVLALAKRAIVVGDDQQTSPENVGQLQFSVHELIDTHLGAIRDRKTRFDQNNSLYDIARQQFPQVVQLREHFRCLPRIIEFSNHRWYNDTIVPLRDRPPRPGWQPLGTVFVPTGSRRGAAQVNVDEAEAVVDLMADLLRDPDYDGMTFGVISLLSGSGQAKHIWEQLVDTIGPDVIEQRRIRVGDPASFQGDERDVVILSMVVSNELDGRIGAMNTAAAGRRVNVAASRAQNQLWIVHSVGPEALHPDDPRRALLEHCLTPSDEEAAQTAFDKAESQFERDVLKRIVDAGYSRVISQYSVGGYRIDIVVEGPEGRRLAVECDGDRWHGPDAWDHDRARQMVLERAGWTFERIRGSAFYRDRNLALEPLWHRLEEMAIPKGDWMGTTKNTVMRRTWPDDFDREERIPASVATNDDGQGAGIAAERPVHDGPAGGNRLTGSLRKWLDPPIEGRSDESAASAPTAREIREWARQHGMAVGERGRLHPDVIAAWNRAFPERHA